MDFPRIQIDQTFGKIGLHHRPARILIEQRPAKLEIRQPKAKLLLRTTGGKLDIDQSQAFAEANLKHVFQLTAEYAALGRKAVLEGIARRAREGDRLMQIEKGGHPIADLARKGAYPPAKQLQIGWMPHSPFSVRFHYEPVRVDIFAFPREPQVNVQTYQPHIKYVPGKIRGWMRQWPTLEITVRGLLVDQKR